MIKIIRNIIATVVVGLALGVILVAFVGLIIHINQIAEKNQQLYNKYEYVIGEKINTSSNITVITNIKIKSNYEVYIVTYDEKEIPISVAEKNIIK